MNALATIAVAMQQLTLQPGQAPGDFQFRLTKAGVEVAVATRSQAAIEAGEGVSFVVDPGQSYVIAARRLDTAGAPITPFVSQAFTTPTQPAAAQDVLVPTTVNVTVS